MNKVKNSAKVLAIIVSCLACAVSQAGNFDNEWFRIFGRWENNQLRADNIQLRLPDKNPNRGQVSGRIDKIDVGKKIIIIGPFTIHWTDKTEFDHCTDKQFKLGVTLKVSGEMVENGYFESRKISLESAPYAPGSLQVTGRSSISQEREDGEHEFTILKIPVHTTQNGYNIFKSLVRRQDVRRPDDQFKFNLMGKPVTIGGEYDLNPGYRDNFDLDSKDRDGSVRIDQELKLEAFYPISRFTAVFLSFKGISETRINEGVPSSQTNLEIARDETWIFFDRIFGTGFGLQFGNQNVSETREWWWDKDMDALRLYYNRGPLHFELTGGKQLGGDSTQISIDPDEDEIYRILGLSSWMWNSKQRLEFYFLQQWDRSTQENKNQIIKRINRDTYDQNMTWLGGRAIGEISLDNYGTLNYWADVAGVHGDETVTEYDSADANGNDLPDNVRRVDKVNRNDVDGWAFDTGAFWTLPFPFEPTFTLSYARASGDSNPNDGHNGTFRQTGINRNNWRFNGVNRFRIYGELLRPELSNLGIFTSAFGIRLLKNSSIELVYHKYDQVDAIDRLRNANINEDPNGLNKDIGQEFNFIANFREWKNLELGLEGAVFEAGKAFGDKEGELSYSIFFDVNYNF